MNILDSKGPDKATRSGIELYARWTATVVAVAYISLRVMAESLFGADWPILWPTVAVVAATAGSVAVLLMYRRNTRRLLRRISYRMCLNCRQVLQGLPDQGICPECGTAYDLGRLTAVWQEEYRPP